MALLECVPNVSEGRRGELLERLAAAVEVPGARLLDLSADPDHHRSVFTLAGEEDALRRGLERLFAVAIEGIDLRAHRGAHPRTGAVDVVPFIPLAGSPMADAVAAAHTFGASVAERCELPVFFYERAALRPERRRLADVRRGGFEGFASKMESPEWAPDAGPPRPHPSAGVAIVGARDFLVAFNVVLRDAGVEAARAIAARVREASGGLRGVRALGLYLPSRGAAQVSMNLYDLTKTSLPEAFARVCAEAKTLGVGVEESEIVGLPPEAAFAGASPEEVGLRGWDPGRILERRLSTSV